MEDAVIFNESIHSIISSNVFKLTSTFGNIIKRTALFVSLSATRLFGSTRRTTSIYPPRVVTSKGGK